MNISVNYKYDNSKKQKDLKSGENLLTFSSMPEDSDNISHMNGAIVRRNGRNIDLVGNTGVIFNNGKDNNTIFHESMHLLGLSDRYDDYRGDHTRLPEGQTTYPHEGYENNVMGNSDTTNLNSFQYEMWMKHAVSRSKANANTNRIIGVMPVDRKGDFLFLPNGERRTSVKQ